MRFYFLKFELYLRTDFQWQQISLSGTCSSQQFDHLSRPTCGTPSCQRCWAVVQASTAVWCCSHGNDSTPALWRWREFDDVLYAGRTHPSFEVGAQMLNPLTYKFQQPMHFLCVTWHHPRQPSYTWWTGKGGEASVAVDKDQTDHSCWCWLRDNSTSEARIDRVRVEVENCDH